MIVNCNFSELFFVNMLIIYVSLYHSTGKSALVMKGLRDPAQQLGLIFASGKFDLNNAALPMSAFIDAMSALTKNIVSEDQGEDVRIIRDHIREEFTEDDQALLLRTMPGCVDLFHTRENNDLDASERSAKRRGSFKKNSNREISSSSAVGKEAILRLQYAIRRLLKIIGLAMKGIVLFIDDLQVSYKLYHGQDVSEYQNISFSIANLTAQITKLVE